MQTSSNRDTEIAHRFHRSTSYLSIRDDAGDEQFVMGVPPDTEEIIWEKDWSIEPFPYKIYETLPPITLPSEFAAPSMPALEAIARIGDEPTGERLPDLADLARIALLSNGILKRGSHRAGGRIIEYRAAGGTGARYHLELYFVCGDLPDLAAGIYHYAAHDHTLRQLRSGDFRATVVEATGQEPAIAAAPVVLAMTSTFWRNAWRYKGRAYRHACWDAGTTFANVLALAASAELPTRLVFGYADRQVNDVLGIDGRREATLALCAIGRTMQTASRSPDVAPLDAPTKPISAYQIDFPIIGEIHGASDLESGETAAAWRANPLQRDQPKPSGTLIPLQPLSETELPQTNLDDVIRKRRSTRHYDTDVTIGFDLFSTLVDRSIRGFAADYLATGALPLHDQYLIVNGVDSLTPGVYRVHPVRKAIELVKAGSFREQAQRLAVSQAYAGDAHVNSYYLADMDQVLERYGNRGYRVAQLEAALAANRLHLGTHALGLGAVGSTSLDSEVVEFFTPDVTGSSYLF
ncbi:MAG: SagB/ThcOx family dehydrogenase, partial [Thermomicrobiales bacterium]